MKATFWTRTYISSRLFTIHFSRSTRWVRSQGRRSNFEITETRFFIPVISENELFERRFKVFNMFIYTESYVNLIETLKTKLVFLALLWVQRRPTAVESDSFEPTSWPIKAVRAREATDDDGAKGKTRKSTEARGLRAGVSAPLFRPFDQRRFAHGKKHLPEYALIFQSFFIQSNSQYVFTLNFTLQRQRFRRDCFFWSLVHWHKAWNPIGHSCIACGGLHFHRLALSQIDLMGRSWPQHLPP